MALPFQSITRHWGESIKQNARRDVNMVKLCGIVEIPYVSFCSLLHVCLISRWCLTGMCLGGISCGRASRGLVVALLCAHNLRGADGGV